MESNTVTESDIQEHGPEMPPEMPEEIKTEDVTTQEQKIAGKVSDKDQSELKNSIKKKGANSYYYAHNYDGQNFNNANAK